ncbi:MAG: radical SAM protein [Bdellovibrionaceae bacterium]|nr:radical SAM protein [Pseudobdellovibrionaceae bacterium]
MSRFSKVNIEISNICNLQCSFCPEVQRHKGLMDEALFRRIIEQVAPHTDQVCFHLMGDPLVHPKLAEFVDICHEHQVRIFLVTNGVLLRDKQAEILLHPAFRQVNFSLHSFGDNYGDKDPGAYLERIFRYTERAFLERPDLYINFRLWNLGDPRGSGEKNRGMLARIEERYQVKISPDIDVRVQKSHLVQNRLYLHFDTEFTWPALDLPVLGTQGRCHGLRSHFGILVDGTVVPCCLDKEAAIPLGRIQDQDLSEILGSPRARALLQGFQRRQLVEDLCQRCQYIERFQTGT